MNYIDCKSVAQKWKEEIKSAKSKGTLYIVQVGHDPASDAYVKGKLKDAAEVEMNAKLISINAESRNQVQRDINWWIDYANFTLQLAEENPNAKEQIDGMIIQLPLPFGLTIKDTAIEALSYSLDVDGLQKNSRFIPCTPDGIIRLMDELKVEIDGKHCVVLGRSDLVGRPVAKLLEKRGGTVSVCHSHTPASLRHQLISCADIVVSAVGSPGIISTNMFKPDAVVIDVGISRIDGKLKGDVTVTEDRDDILLTPVPGGVGLLTRAMLLKHTQESHERRIASSHRS